jgi:hypothetical protein
MSEYWGDDERWLAELREALQEAGQVPRAVLEAGYSAYAWRTIDAELAELTYDSSTEDPALAGARSQQAPLRSLTFATGSVTLELQIEPPVLLGQVVPAQPGELLVTLRDGTSRTVPVDELGCFTVDPIPAVQFRIRMAGEQPVATGWITL